MRGATHRHARGRWYRRPGGPWDPAGPATLDALFATAETTLVDGTVKLSAAALEDVVARTAGGLRAAGVRRGDTVAWQLPNRWEAVVLYRACWRLGAVAAPVHHLAGPADVDRMLGQVDPRLVVESLPEGPPVREWAARPADPAVVLFTSGSSGTPKAAVHTQRGLAWKARLMGEVHGLRSRDAVLMPAPLAHVSGLLNAVLLPGAIGMKAVLQQRWDPDAALDLIEAQRISFMLGPPTFFVSLRDAASFDRKRVRSLRLVSCGGAGVTPAFVEETAAELDAFVKRTYGSTEAPTVTTAHAGDPADLARTTDGRPTGEVEVRLDPATGEVLLRGPELFAGYTDPERTAAAFAPGGWFRTGDRGSIGNGGWLTITGRLKDVIIRGGENIATAEVEAVAESHPSVRQAVAVGVPDRRLGERVALFVVVAPGAATFDLDECRRWFAASGVARFKTPERVEAVDALPTLPAGKPDREALRSRI